MANKPVLGELTEKDECGPFNFKEVSWKIVNVSSLLRSDDIEVKSSVFSFANASWILCSNDFVHFKLCRLSCETEQEVYYKLFIKSSHGEELESFISCHNFTATSSEDGNDLLHFKSRSKLAAYLKEIAHDDTLTVFCQMNTRSKLVKATSQEEIAEPVRTSSDVAEGNMCESFIFKEVAWKIQDFRELSEESLRCARSPEFSFANGRWILSTRSMDDDEEEDDDDEEEEEEGYVAEDEGEQCFNLCRIHSSETEQEVFFKFSLTTGYGKELETFIGCHNYTCMEEDDDSVFCVKIKELLRKQFYTNVNEEVGDEFTDGDLIVICQMHTKKTAPASQEEIIRPVMRILGSETNVAQPTKILYDYEKLLLSEDGCDVILRVREKNFRAHQAILRARSPVFASMLRNNMKESNTGRIDIVDCEPENFSDFLRFLYCGNAESINAQNVCSLYRAAHKYAIQDFKSGCVMFMKRHLSVDNFCDIITLALQYVETDLIKQATDFFVKNVAKIIVTAKWQTFLTENPIEGNELFIKSLPANESS